MNPQSPAASKFAGAGVVAAVVCGLATPAAALDDRRLFALAVVVELQDAGKLASFGSLNLFMRRLRLAGHVCNTSPYAYGVNISCGTNTQSPLVLIHLDFAPTRGPDFLSVGGGDIVAR